MNLHRSGRMAALLCLLVAAGGFACCAQELAPNDTSRAAEARQRKRRQERDESRAAANRKEARREQALRAIVSSLGLGEGATILDIGAGRGRDTWVFAEIVGSTGRVVAEEIGEQSVATIKREAQQRGLSHVEAVQGTADDPRLPANAGDLAYMRHVYHHFTQPREMLRGIWRGLKPGGYLVVVDRRKGTLRDWVPRAQRGAKHFWIAETTVVREAREEGFEFVRCAEELWPADDQFVLVFQRPRDLSQPGVDPDALPAVDTARLEAELLPDEGSYRRPVFIALGPARVLIPAILQHATSPGLELVLEEWATQKDERPAVPAGVSLPATLTERGVPDLGDQPTDAVFFLDTYHLLFHHRALLAALHAALTAEGRIFVLDRPPAEPLSRRLSSHHRRISRVMVQDEMRSAGFTLLRTGPATAGDRYLLVFGKASARSASPE